MTVHQINFRLQRELGLRPEQPDAACRKLLEQLIEGAQRIIDPGH